MKIHHLCPVCATGVAEMVRTSGRGGRQQVYCSLKCRQSADWQRRRESRLNPLRVEQCGNCHQFFETRIIKQKYCSEECRLTGYRTIASVRWHKENPKPEIYIYDCDLCAEPIERPKPLGGRKRYHPDCAVIAQQARYRKKTVKRQSTTKPSGAWVEQILEAYGYICYLCNEPIDMKLPRTSKRGATVDHVLPLSRGGSDELENLRLTHWSCNRAKSNKLVEELNG